MGCRGRMMILSSLWCLLDVRPTDGSHQAVRRLQTCNIIYFQTKRTATSQENGNSIANVPLCWVMRVHSCSLFCSATASFLIHDSFQER